MMEGDERGTKPEAEGEPATEHGASSEQEEGRSRKQAPRDVWEKGFSEFQDVVGDIIGSFRNLPPLGGRYPRHDLIQVPGEGYWVLIDLPGVAKTDLDVTIVGDDVAVSGERARPELPEGSEVLASGRAYGRFRREVRIPSDVDHAGVRAKLDDGVLTLVLPRRTETERQRVEIED